MICHKSFNRLHCSKRHCYCTTNEKSINGDINLSEANNPKVRDTQIVSKQMKIQYPELVNVLIQLANIN